MSERKNKTPGTAKDNNALYILIFTVVVVIGIAVFIFSKNNSSKMTLTTPVLLQITMRAQPF